jgi:hypothetical protein
MVLASPMYKSPMCAHEQQLGEGIGLMLLPLFEEEHAFVKKCVRALPRV